MKPLIEIRCDGDERVGYGHIRRSMTLADALTVAGLGVRLVGLSETARRLLPVVEQNSGSDRRRPAVIVFDSLLDIDREIAAARDLRVPIVTLDYFGQEVPDINIVVFPHSQPKARWRDGLYVGYPYILIREDIRQTALLADTVSNATSMSLMDPVEPTVLVCVGGADLLGQSLAAADLLSQGGARVTVVRGPMVRGPSVKIDPLKAATPAYDLVENPSDLPKRFLCSDWLVTNGGGCLFEALFLERPVHVLAQTPAEERVSADLEKAGVLLGRGFNRLRCYTREELTDFKERRRADGNHRIVDGRGAERIVKVIQEAVGRG